MVAIYSKKVEGLEKEVDDLKAEVQEKEMWTKKAMELDGNLREKSSIEAYWKDEVDKFEKELEESSKWLYFQRHGGTQLSGSLPFLKAFGRHW
ncbi:unnamed protein product [Calypogeia fissa]